MSTSFARQSSTLHERVGRPATPDNRGRSQELRWRAHYWALAGFVREAGHARPPSDCVTRDGYGIGAWVVHQRMRYRAGRLAVHRKDLLEGLPGWSWNGARTNYDMAWERAFSDLQQFVATHGHAQPAWKQSGADIRLGVWVYKQRVYYRDGRLSLEKVQRLEALPGWVWTFQDACWERAFEYLRDFMHTHGAARPPSTYKAADGFGLGKWVKQQRMDCRAGLLDPDRVRRLEALPGWVWNGRQVMRGADPLWDKHFEALVGYVAKRGHACPGPEEQEYDWVVSQRRSYARGRLTADQVARLQGLPQWRWRLRSVRRGWSDYYAAFLRYVADNGHARPPARFCTVEGMYLGQWTVDQRAAFRRGLLSQERVRLLEEVPGWDWQPLTSPGQASSSARATC